MNVLWITNILLPEARSLLDGQKDLKSSGGWILGAASGLIENPNTCLSIATVSNLVSELKVLRGENIVYYVLPLGRGNVRYNREYESLWLQVRDMVKPDIVHLHGSEFTHGLAYVNACGTDNVVLSIQGLRSVLEDYYFQGLSKWEVLKNTTIHDIIKCDGLIAGYHENKELSKTEVELIQKVKHIIGRTSWDKAHTWAINPKATYYFCNETLRPEFYSGELWSYDRCQKHAIFLSQAANPIKGLHQLLKAMPIILQHFPDTQVRIAGYDIIRNNIKCRSLRVSGYGKILGKYIERYHLQKHITFTGNLNADEMKREYLNANVFVMPSSIENSPNSLGEAQILGAPHVASYVGGACDMMVGNEENLYRFDDYTMLAEKVCRIFENKDKQVNMSDSAVMRHNPEINTKQLLTIYSKIIGHEIF